MIELIIESHQEAMDNLTPEAKDLYLKIQELSQVIKSTNPEALMALQKMARFEKSPTPAYKILTDALQNELECR